MTQGLSFRVPNPDDAEMLLEWRLRPEIASQMFTAVENDVEKQRAWLRRSNERDDYVHRIMMVDGIPVGYASITVTNPEWRICTFGVYMADRRGRTGMGPFNFTHMLNHVFYTMGQRKVVNHILASNERVVKGQTMLGYRHVGTLREQVVKDGRAQDLHIFEMLETDWRTTRSRYGILMDMDGREWP
ncbi:GNAT family N-acetyltransferase [Azospirillum sp. SYSU D00513]|uniref:GNAT family N-acetyltransferase n=1 Tax=Azospirillum sp. SYSU D00513 TaxID=2812561 RepID=UPI001A9787AD|nr:GNAT family N-acetyltransferase [Azospirillum sp. SYSU D00513]